MSICEVTENFCPLAFTETSLKSTILLLCLRLTEIVVLNVGTNLVTLQGQTGWYKMLEELRKIWRKGILHYLANIFFLRSGKKDHSVGFILKI